MLIVWMKVLSPLLALPQSRLLPRESPPSVTPHPRALKAPTLWFPLLVLSSLPGTTQECFSQSKPGFLNSVWLAYYISGSRFPLTRSETSLLPQTRLGGRGVQWTETALEAATRFSGHLTCFTVNCPLPLGHFDVTTLGLLLSSAVAKEKPHKICFVFSFSSC